MALFNPTFLFGLLVLFYLSSFVFFAIVRILTGISIQRIGYFSLRRIVYTPRDGCRIEIRRLGLSLHRPTFAQPTWISIALNDLLVTLNPRHLQEAQPNPPPPASSSDTDSAPDGSSADGPAVKSPRQKTPTLGRNCHPDSDSDPWVKLVRFKEKLQRLHRNLKWLRLIDVIATNSIIHLVDVGNIQLGSLTLAVDTRCKSARRARISPDKDCMPRDSDDNYHQAEWIFTLRSMLFTVDGSPSLEILDHCLFSVHGWISHSKDGLRDATIDLKLGRLQIPCDDLQTCASRFRRHRPAPEPPASPDPASGCEFDPHPSPSLEEPDMANEALVRTVSESKEFFSSILRGIKEVRIAVSLFVVTKKISWIHPSSKPVFLDASMKEIGVDFHRLDPKSPAHRMYFPSRDIAHEALVAALSIAVGLDNGSGKPERILYIPMATTTARTTLPSKSFEMAEDGSVEEMNTNILFASSVITSPSIDLDPYHLPILIAILQSKPKSPQEVVRRKKRHHLISRLLPKANIIFSMQEPAIRMRLKPLQPVKDPDDYDLIISSVSSISLDLESFHSSSHDVYYSLDGTLRLQSHRLYYQTSFGEHFNLMTTDCLDLKVNLLAKTKLCIDATASLQSFCISMVRQEITDGLRQIVRQLRIHVEPDKRAHPKKHSGRNFLRSLPESLVRFKFDATDINAEVAGPDELLSSEPRGLSLHLDNLSAEYSALKVERPPLRPMRRRTHSRNLTQSDSDLPPSSPPEARDGFQNVGDGRRLSLQTRGIEAQVLETPERYEEEPFISIPAMGLVLSASSDSHGPFFHVEASVQTLRMKYSLYRYYSIGVAAMTLRKAFMKTARDAPESLAHEQALEAAEADDAASAPAMLDPDGSHSATAAAAASSVTHELVTVDIKASQIQIKAEMPHEPLVMLHVYGLEMGRSRWSTPFLSSKLIRFCVEPPRTPGVWARMISIKRGRVDLRSSKHRQPAGNLVDEKMIDVTSEAIRVGVPHEVIVYHIIDNFINVAKASLQLHHRFKTGTDEYILGKHPEGPKHVPKVSVRTRSLLFELEDGAFEWKLGMIYRAGRVEQMQRLSREEAFHAKAKRVREELLRRGGPRHRPRSATPRGRAEHSSSSSPSSWFRSRSSDGLAKGGDRHGRPRGLPRYEPDQEWAGISGQANVSIEEARAQMHVFNAQSWKRRINRAYKESQTQVAESRNQFWGSEMAPEGVEETESILEVPLRPALMSAMMSDVRFVVDKPTFPMAELPDFLHRVGKGMPRDMLYILLVPMHVSIEMGEARVSLRDYPLPFVYIPCMKSGQARKPSVMLNTNIVLAEEYQGPESTRTVRTTVVPTIHAVDSEGSGGDVSSGANGFAIDVLRTVSPVKSYSEVFMDINTALPTQITWSPCYQPAVQDMMTVIESFSKPQLDPSERVGFWDKFRLVFHSRVWVAWKGDGDMHLHLKGTRDPYLVTRAGAGFLMCWRNNVRWHIHVEDDPKRFMTVDSEEYLLAVPDNSHLVREAARRHVLTDGSATGPEEDTKVGAMFKKVVMKLSGNVQWVAGLVFESCIEGGKRSFDFRPHYEVVLKNPIYAKPTPEGLPYDAMRGFRSRHIHLSISVRAPADRDWLSPKPQPSKSYNTVHLTPRFFTHFFKWWGLFSHPMSLPIRQGKLFPNGEKQGKKFGKHLATVKYSLLLAPLFLSHIYKHKDLEDDPKNAVSATGLKLRLDCFMLDLHQRREEFNTEVKNKKAQNRVSAMKIHAAHLDLASADVRAVSASLKGTTTEAIMKGSLSTLMADRNEKSDSSRFTIPDSDLSWIDMDDFVEIDWILPTEPHPDTDILPLAFIPRLTFFRQTDIGGVIAGDPTRTSPFGGEMTHFCIMTQEIHPRRIQAQVMRERLAQLDAQTKTHSQHLAEAELKVRQTQAPDAEMLDNLAALQKHTLVLEEKKALLESILERVDERPLGRRQHHHRHGVNGHSRRRAYDSDEALNIPLAADFESDYKNRVVVHNMQLKWNNVLRNIVLRYIHNMSQRQGFIYYLSRPAVKFIMDIVEDQHRAKSGKSVKACSTAGASSSPESSIQEKEEAEAAAAVEARIKNFLRDGRRFLSSDFGPNEDGTSVSIEDLESGISKGFSPQNNYHLRLIAPQIQLQSDKNDKHVVLVTAKSMELKEVEVMDETRLSDPVSGLVQRRMLVSGESIQFFVAQEKLFSRQNVCMYAGNRYGTPSGSAWPPWVPMEVMFDYREHPFGFQRVVQKTSATMRYDQHNHLRLKYHTGLGSDNNSMVSVGSTECSKSRMDKVWIEFPQLRALCNSSQYYAMYVIVLDLLLYSEPMEKNRSERLEKIMLASDFSDLSGAPKMVQKLQERVRQLEEIKDQFQVYAKYLDKKGWEDRLAVERDLVVCQDELFFMMKAITTSQRKHDVNSDANALLKYNIWAREIVWHLMQDSNQQLVELQLKDVEYDRTDISDSSYVNLIRVGSVLGLNLMPDATYPEMIAPYHHGDEEMNVSSSLLASSSTSSALRAAGASGSGVSGGTGSGTCPGPGEHERDMVRVYWHMLEAIAGIPVMDRFEVELLPFKLELEHEVSTRLVEYIFPGMDGDKESASSSSTRTKKEGQRLQPTVEQQHQHGGVHHQKHRHHRSSTGAKLDLEGLQEEEDEEAVSPGSSSKRLAAVASGSDKESMASFATRTGSLELRMRPTLSSHKPHLPHLGHMGKSGSKGTHGSDGHSLRLFRSSVTSKPSILTKRPSRESLGGPGGGVRRSATRSSSKDSRESGTRRNRGQAEGKQVSDDLNKMMTRASNYMTFSHIRMPEVVLCLSLKGKDHYNFEDVHNLVLKIPAAEWRNKTWSNLDLYLALKKMVVKALISNTGAIISNKLSKSRPNAEQRSRLRELASSSVLISSGPGLGSSPPASLRQRWHQSPRREAEGRRQQPMYGGGLLEEERESDDESEESYEEGEDESSGVGSFRLSMVPTVEAAPRGTASAGGAMSMRSAPMPPAGHSEAEAEVEGGRKGEEGAAAAADQSQDSMSTRGGAGSSRWSMMSSSTTMESAGPGQQQQQQRRRAGTGSLRERLSALAHRRSQR